jgi:hypothetical protein
MQMEEYIKEVFKEKGCKDGSGEDTMTRSCEHGNQVLSSAKGEDH